MRVLRLKTRKTLILVFAWGLMRNANSKNVD